MDSVVFVYNVRGAACTGALISPRVVLTAKHCIQGTRSGAAPASQFRVYMGDSTSRFTAEFTVAEVRPAPGCWDLCGDASDVAVMILSTPSSVPPIPVSFDSAGSLVGRDATAIGFGQTPSGSSGTKYRTMARVENSSRGLIFVDPSVCSGDSGGPLIGADGRIYGVASFIYSPDGRSEPRCGTAPGAYNGIANYMDLIATAIADGGDCLPTGGPETCNGVDDDCNDLVDETCTPLGSLCTSDDECVGGLCGDTPSGRVCTQPCDPLRPALGCPPGLYCAGMSGCDGLCAPGAAVPEALGYGRDCTRNEECASLLCANPGDGRQRCLTPCRGDAGMCFAGEVCSAGAGACGACVASEIVRGARGLGEPCTVDGECASASCFDDHDVLYCSRTCATDAECGAGFHCRGTDCARGAREGIGGGCVANEDCADPDGTGPLGAICAERGGVSWCTAFCSGDAACPPGFSCVPAGGAMVCAPTGGALVGEECLVNPDCLSGLCIDAGHGLVCTRFCDAETRCSAGFECVRTGDGRSAVCVAPVKPPRADSGGCATSPSRGGTSIASVALALLVALGALSRRRRG
jgi:V8-like Glu-specific endopeptidase